MEVSFETAYHQTEAIRLVNERLSDPEAQLTDALIGSVAILANFEVSHPAIKAFGTTHND